MEAAEEVVERVDEYEFCVRIVEEAVVEGGRIEGKVEGTEIKEVGIDFLVVVGVECELVREVEVNLDVDSFAEIVLLLFVVVAETAEVEKVIELLLLDEEARVEEVDGIVIVVDGEELVEAVAVNGFVVVEIAVVVLVVGVKVVVVVVLVVLVVVEEEAVVVVVVEDVVVVVTAVTVVVAAIFVVVAGVIAVVAIEGIVTGKVGTTIVLLENDVILAVEVLKCRLYLQ